MYIGGEGTLNGSKAHNGFIDRAAKRHKALVFGVEHRFYGKSLNVDGLELKNLQFLSSHQALSDLASFHEAMTRQFELPTPTKWVCFGGSYPGALSAWFRIKFPHLVVGAVSSSSPVKALLDFNGYNHVVAESLEDPLVGGSQKCLNGVKSAFKAVDKLIEDGQLGKLSLEFISCKPILTDALDLYAFVSNLADVFMGTTQYNNQGTSNFTIESVCSIMTSHPAPYDALVHLNGLFLKSNNLKCADNRWQDMLDQMANTTFDSPVGDMRQWIYQTCSQFGYYQSCEGDDCPFSSHMTLAPNLELCRRIYGITPGMVKASVEFTNAFYGSNHPRGSHILFVNGLIDPWHVLSVLGGEEGEDEETIVIPGASHCQDMRDARPTDPAVLKQAREDIMSTLDRWLA